MKVTIEQIESKITSETYLVLPDGRTTLCILSLENGYTITGKSACVMASEFDLVLGRKYARENAVEQIWPLEGYLLAQRVFDQDPLVVEEIYVQAEKAFDVEYAKRKKPHWTQTAKGRKIMATRKRKGQK
jgi:hypothetical protein